MARAARDGEGAHELAGATYLQPPALGEGGDESLLGDSEPVARSGLAVEILQHRRVHGAREQAAVDSHFEMV